MEKETVKRKRTVIAVLIENILKLIITYYYNNYVPLASHIFCYDCEHKKENNYIQYY